MRRASATIVAAVVLALTLWPASPAAAQTQSPNSPTSGELVESPKEFDGSRIEFTGEVIGEAMVRGDMAWIHINDDAYYLKNIEEGAELGGYNSGHAVWLPADLLGPVEHFGDYRNEGDVIRVAGVFNAACAEHGGDMDIHATRLDVVHPGRPVEDPIHRWKIGLAAGVTLLAALLFVVLRMLDARGVAFRD